MRQDRNRQRELHSKSKLNRQKKTMGGLDEGIPTSRDSAHFALTSSAPLSEIRSYRMVATDHQPVLAPLSLQPGCVCVSASPGRLHSACLEGTGHLCFSSSTDDSDL